MREVQASDAKTHLPQLLDDVERGEVILITRHGRPIAWLVPEVAHRKAEIQAAIDGILALRKGRTLRKESSPISPEEIRDLIDEGRKY
jgi:prevent-host-death family protein